MGLNFFFCIKKFLHFRYNDPVTEWYTNSFKLLLGFILIKSLQYRINSCQFIVMCFDKLHNILAVFFWPQSFIFFILSFLITSFLGNSLCIERYSWFYAESLILSFPDKFRFQCLNFCWYLFYGFIIPLINKVITLFCCFKGLLFWLACNIIIVILIPANFFMVYISNVMIWFRS